MNHRAILTLCMRKKGAYIDHPFGPDSDIIKVKGKIFAQLFWLHGEEMVTFKCDRMAGEIFRARFPEAVTRGYHCPPVQQPYWNTVKLDGSVPDDIIAGMVEHAYTVVVEKLTKKQKRELEEE